jgi:alkylhydroperoxidase family enzyme
MARVQFATQDTVTGKAKEAYENHIKNNNLTNMKQALLQDEATYEAYMGWYKSWGRLVEIVGKQAAMVLAHSISTTNDCLLCSLFFISDLKASGLNPGELALDEKEQLLSELGKQMVKNPNKISEEVFQGLKKHFSDAEIVVIVGFAGQMIATNNFNSALQIDVDQRLLPIQGEFKPATWRKNI